ncbi:MAG: hypothetical protein H7263_01300 [Candidatus Sericytochromatia bacterium]|nr:hypothetical protein [Candidatus Sericytochromatia bacterium]
MLLKANSVKYQELLTQDVEDDLEYFLDEEQDEIEEFEIGQTILLGTYENRFLEDGEEPFAEEEIDSSLKFDEESGVFIGQTIVMGGYIERVQEDYFVEDSGNDEIDDLLNGDLDSLTDEPKKIQTEGEELLSNFSDAVNSLSESLEKDLPSWKDVQVGTSADKAANSVLEGYKSNNEVDFSQYEFISQQERDDLLAEVSQLINDAKDFNTMNNVMNDLEITIQRIVESQTEYYKQDVETEREQIMIEVETHIEDVLNQQREVVQNEAEEHIERTVQFFKKKMSEDEQLLVAATNINSRRDQILDEAYSRSLTLIEEASEQANRIIEDSKYSMQEAERIKEEAKYEGQAVEQRYQQEAEGIVSDAHIESSKIIQNAEEQHQEIVEAATQDGFNVGYQEGREEAIRENAQLLMDTTNALNELHVAFPAAVKENEGKLIKIAIRVADALIKDEIVSRPEICVKILDKAIRRVSDLERVLIKVNPLDLDLILPKENYFRGLLSDVQDFIITGHYAIPRGGCLIETNSGTIDGQFQSQLVIVEDLFNKIRSEYDDAEEEIVEEEVEA